MIRTLLLGACVALLCGCNSARKTTVAKTAPGESPDPPKQYEYRDMSRGGYSSFATPKAGSSTMVK